MSDIVKKVSVAVITYNHENYIYSCLNSIATQCGNFEIEIVVGDDASVDNTREVIDGFDNSHKVNIKKIYHRINSGVVKNFCDVIDSCTGDYIAIIDGDDLMLPGKLAAQFELMEADLCCSLVHHNVNRINSIGNVIEESCFSRQDVVEGDLNSLFYNAQEGIQSCAVMIRSSQLDENWKSLFVDGSPIQDLPFIIYCARKGSVKYIDMVLSSYRIHSSSILNSYNMVSFEKYVLRHILLASLVLDVNAEAARYNVAIIKVRIAIFLIESGKLIEAFKFFFSALPMCVFMNKRGLRVYARFIKKALSKIIS